MNNRNLGQLKTKSHHLYRNVKVKDEIIPVHATKARGGRNIRIIPLILNFTSSVDEQ